jgi:hypothetical protein
MSFQIGADPEIFLQDAAGAMASAIGRIGGTKAHPRPLPLGDGFAMQEDNVALEYNVPPAGSCEEFQDNIQRIMAFLSSHVATMGLQFSTLSATHFPVQLLQHPQAMEFGCDPDFNAWNNGRMNPRPQAPNQQLRTCGGHVHIGAEFKSRQEMLAFIRRCDLMLAVPATILDDGHLRKQLYGKMGAFRPKKFGCEYRVLSNFWIFTPELIGFIYRNTKLALESTIDPRESEAAIVDAVNNNSKAAALYLIDKYNIPMLHV